MTDEVTTMNVLRRIPVAVALLEMEHPEGGTRWVCVYEAEVDGQRLVSQRSAFAMAMEVRSTPQKALDRMADRPGLGLF